MTYQLTDRECVSILLDFFKFNLWEKRDMARKACKVLEGNWPEYSFKAVYGFIDGKSTLPEAFKVVLELDQVLRQAEEVAK